MSLIDELRKKSSKVNNNLVKLRKDDDLTSIEEDIIKLMDEVAGLISEQKFKKANDKLTKDVRDKINNFTNEATEFINSLRKNNEAAESIIKTIESKMNELSEAEVETLTLTMKTIRSNLELLKTLESHYRTQLSFFKNSYQNLLAQVKA